MSNTPPADPEDYHDGPQVPSNSQRGNMAGNGWDQWRNAVLRDLARTERKVEALTKQVGVMGRQLEGLKVKSGVWGAMAACIPIALLLLMQWIKD